MRQVRPPSIVGRDEELAGLNEALAGPNEALRAARHGRGGLIVVSGDERWV